LRSAEVIPVIARRVVVACEDVELRAVKFCKVDEPVTRRLERVERPPVAVRVVPTVREPAVRPLGTETTPLVSIERAAVVDVANVLAEEVATYNAPPALRKVQ